MRQNMLKLHNLLNLLLRPLHQFANNFKHYLFCHCVAVFVRLLLFSGRLLLFAGHVLSLITEGCRLFIVRK